MKKQLIERQCQGLLEFIEPKWTLDTVVGHEPVKQRLREDARTAEKRRIRRPCRWGTWLRSGGYRQDISGAMHGRRDRHSLRDARNFRSKYVGETEGNLERVLSVLRAMGPVIVVVDEADAAFGDRAQEGDSGTSSRVFSMIAAQMGDTRYRGQIIWMLLTSRPDLLPIDLKRQGRAEVHIPLFYPADQEEIRAHVRGDGEKTGR